MGSIYKAQKIHAMKNQNRQFLYNLMLHSLIALTCSFMFSGYSYLFSSLSTFSLNQFLFISLPQIWSSMFNPKFLFAIVNVIVVFLVGESKIGSTNSCPANEIYKEYMEKSQSQRRGIHAKSLISREEKKTNVKINDESVALAKSSPANETGKECVKMIRSPREIAPEMGTKINDEVVSLPIQVKSNIQIDCHMTISKKANGDSEFEVNKRAEEFIARVNKQRRLEQSLL